MIQILRIFAIICFSLGFSAKSFACSCDGKYREYKHAIKESTLIFSGKVVRISTAYVNTKYGPRADMTYKIVPDRIWKGAVSDTINIPYANDCISAYLEPGKTYIIFTKPDKSLDFCQRIIEVDKEGEKANHDKDILDRKFRKPKRTR